MNGLPVWLVSLSRRVPPPRMRLLGYPASSPIIPTGRWSTSERREAERTILDVLSGAGDRTRERLFRMNVTMCLHRALTPDEINGLPLSFHAAPPVDLAGGPIEILRETVLGRASTRPCEQPTHMPLSQTDPDLWFPADCGTCSPCIARSSIASYVGGPPP